MNVYYQIRSSQLDRSIKGLREHFRKSSSASGVPYSPAIPNKRKDTPTKKPVKRPGESPPWPREHQPEGGVGPGLLSAPPELVGAPPAVGAQDRQQVSSGRQGPRPVRLSLLRGRVWGLHQCLGSR